LTRGFVKEDENLELLDQARQAIVEMLSEHGPALLADHEEVRVEVRKRLRRFFNQKIKRRPLILPIIHTM
jgi:ribonuclease J